LSSQADEVILAQEQGTTLRLGGARKELEAEFGGSKEGTLILTNKRVIFACTGETEEDLPGETGLNPTGKIRLVYSEVDDLDDVPQRSPNVFIPITSITSAEGHGQGLERPSLKVAWNDAAGKHEVVFSETLIRPGKRSLNDWAAVLGRLKAGTQNFAVLPSPPPVDTLDGKIMRVLADMQEKGLFAIEEAVEDRFKIQLDPDEVEEACEHLVTSHLLARNPDPSGGGFYRRVSPLGEDSFSS
jgi:hypothetical protein